MMKFATLGAWLTLGKQTMPCKQEIMDAIRTGLNGLSVTSRDNDGEWTQAVNKMLCSLGVRFGYQVGAHGHGFKEWLYDITWLEYTHGYTRGVQNKLVDSLLVAECEWRGSNARKDDFEKLLQARAGIRLFIYDASSDPGPEGVAQDLAEYYRNFRRSCSDDAWLLAGRQKRGGNWSFQFFTLQEGGDVIPYL